MDALGGLIKEMADPRYLRTSNNTAKDRAVAGQAPKRSPMGDQCGRALHPARLATPEIAESGSHRRPRPRDTLVLVPFGIAAELAAAVSKRGHELDIVLLEERPHINMERIGRRQLINRCVNKSAKNNCSAAGS